MWKFVSRKYVLLPLLAPLFVVVVVVGFISLTNSIVPPVMIDIPSEVETTSIKVSISTDKTVYQAGETSDIQLVTTNKRHFSIQREWGFSFSVFNSRGEEIFSSVMNILLHQSALQIAPKSESVNEFPLYIDPRRMPPDTYTVVIKMDNRQIAVATKITVTGCFFPW